MGLLVNTYIFYADIYFIQNFIIKLAIAFLVTKFTKQYEMISLLRINLICFLATVSEIVFLVVFSNYTMFGLFVYLIEIPTMMVFLIQKKTKQRRKGYLCGCVFTILINGTLEALVNLFGETAHYLGLLVLSCFIVILGTLHMLRQKNVQKGIVAVELFHGGTICRVHAYYDSGNCLKDPYTGKGVHIASEQVLSKLVQVEDKKVCIPYQSLGNETGLLDVYYIEKLQVHSEKGIIELQKIPLGVTNENLFEGKQYEMILNEDIW